MCVDLNLKTLYTCNNWLLYKIYQCNNNKSTEKNDKWSSFSKGLMKTCVWLAPHKLNFCHTLPLAKFRLPRFFGRDYNEACRHKTNRVKSQSRKNRGCLSLISNMENQLSTISAVLKKLPKKVQLWIMSNFWDWFFHVFMV